MRIAKQSTAKNLKVFMTDSTDRTAGKTGLTLTITACKDGESSFTSISPTVTDLGNGWYNLALTTTHTNTLGDMALHITATGADPSDPLVLVVANDLATALPANSNLLSIDANGRVDVIKVAGTTQTARDLGASVLLSPGTGTGQLAITAGAVTVGTNNDKTGYTASTVSDKTGYSISGTKTTLDALNDLSAAGIRAATGMASANLDTQLSAIAGYIDTEVATILAAVDTEISSLTTELAKVPKSDSTITWNATALGSILTQVNVAIDTAISELGVGAPTATPTLRTGLMLLYMALRNKLITQTSGTDALEIYNDAGTKITQKLLTDDGSDYTEAKMT
jgi:hypothetical protein